MFAFTPAHLARDFKAVPIDATLCIAGYPLGFQDTVHQLPVLRHAAIASMNNSKKLFTRTLELFIVLSVEKRAYSSLSVGWMNNRCKMGAGDE